MNIATILVHLDRTDRCAQRVALAARLARAHGSHLAGLIPTGLHDGAIPIGALPAGNVDFLSKSADYLRQRAEDIAQAFKDGIGGAGALSYEVRRVDGPVAEAVVRHARTSDLVIVGQDRREADDDVVARDIAQQVMMQAGRPVLVVPYAGRFDDAGRRAIAAWDGSRAAAVAIRDALPLLRKASTVTLAAFRGAGEAQDEGRLQTAELEHWLLRHGVQAICERHVTGIPVSDALLSRAADLGADLIVMGGYGHTRLRELVLGGVTREILAHMTVPILMSH